MWITKARSRTGASGVAKIKRHSYNTVNGTSAKSAWWEIRAKVFKRDGGQCVPCARLGRLVPGSEVHHIIALESGGTTTMANLLTLCKACHDKRHHHLFKARRR